MIRVQFISVQTLKDNSQLQANVDEKILNLAIKEFQDIELERILTKPEYDRLQDVVIGSLPPTEPIVPLSDADTLLLEYIRPVMIYGALVYSISPIHIKLTNAGAKTDSYQNSVSDDLAAARADYTFKLDGYKRKLTDYISSVQTTADATKPKNNVDSTFDFTGMALPDHNPDYEKAYQNANYKTGGYGFII